MVTVPVRYHVRPHVRRRYEGFLKVEAVLWYFSKVILLFVSVLVVLRLGAELMAVKIDAVDHLRVLSYADWLVLSVIGTASLLFFHATVSWVIKRDDAPEANR